MILIFLTFVLNKQAVYLIFCDNFSLFFFPYVFFMKKAVINMIIYEKFGLGLNAKKETVIKIKCT